jgi:catalase
MIFCLNDRPNDKHWEPFLYPALDLLNCQLVLVGHEELQMNDDQQFNTRTGAGGEIHQHIAATGSHEAGETHLTTNQGMRISDNQNSLKSGERGPTLLEDFVLREKIFHFDHERIPERIVHARGSAAHGFFEATDDISDLTKAAVFVKGTKTPVFARFSTVAGG